MAADYFREFYRFFCSSCRYFKKSKKEIFTMQKNKINKFKSSNVTGYFSPCSQCFEQFFNWIFKILNEIFKIISFRNIIDYVKMG